MVPIIYSELYSSVLNSTLHVVLLDYKFETDLQALEDILFPNSEARLRGKHIDKVYDTFVLLLATVYNEVKNLISKVIKHENCRSTSIKQRKRIKLPLLVKIKDGLDFDKTETGVRRALLSQCTSLRNKFGISELIINEIKEVASDLCQIRFDFEEILKNNSEIVFDILEVKYNNIMRQK